MEAFFHRISDELYEPTLSTRGPWSAEHQHGGPPSALVAGRLEASMPEGFSVARVSVEITRPVPVETLSLETSLVRDGRTAKIAVGKLVDRRGQVVMTTEALALRGADLGVEASQPNMDEKGPHRATPAEFPFFDLEPSYNQAVETRFSRGAFGTGDVMAWLKMRVPLIDGLTPTPLERVMVAADSGNGVSQRLDTRRYSFINPDLTVALHRHPNGEWVGLAARTDFDTRGIGLADSRIYDERGPVGRGLQTLVIRTRD